MQLIGEPGLLGLALDYQSFAKNIKYLQTKYKKKTWLCSGWLSLRPQGDFLSSATSRQGERRRPEDDDVDVDDDGRWKGWEGTLLLLPICEIPLTGGLIGGGDAGEESGLLKVREGETW